MFDPGFLSVFTQVVFLFRQGKHPLSVKAVQVSVEMLPGADNLARKRT